MLKMCSNLKIAELKGSRGRVGLLNGEVGETFSEEVFCVSLCVCVFFFFF